MGETGEKSGAVVCRFARSSIVLMKEGAHRGEGHVAITCADYPRCKRSSWGIDVALTPSSTAKYLNLNRSSSRRFTGKTSSKHD